MELPETVWMVHHIFHELDAIFDIVLQFCVHEKCDNEPKGEDVVGDGGSAPESIRVELPEDKHDNDNLYNTHQNGSLKHAFTVSL